MYVTAATVCVAICFAIVKLFTAFCKNCEAMGPANCLDKRTTEAPSVKWVCGTGQWYTEAHVAINDG